MADSRADRYGGHLFYPCVPRCVHSGHDHAGCGRAGLDGGRRADHVCRIRSRGVNVCYRDGFHDRTGDYHVGDAGYNADGDDAAGCSNRRGNRNSGRASDVHARNSRAHDDQDEATNAAARCADQIALAHCQYVWRLSREPEQGRLPWRGKGQRW